MMPHRHHFPANPGRLWPLVGLTLSLLGGCAKSPPPAPTENPIAPPPPRINYFPAPLGEPVATFGRPMVTHLQIVDLDQDGLNDIIYAEARLNTVRWIHQSPAGVFTDRLVAANVPGPAHVEAADVQNNGRLDILVASMGQITPNNDRIGAVWILENLGNDRFEPHVVLKNTARVSDVRAANFSGHADGRLDLVVGQFGYAQGATQWMKNLGGWQFESHVVNRLSGPVHTPVADFDGDGRPDFVSLISQEWEEIHGFLSSTAPAFTDAIIWGSTNEDYGSSGLEAADVNQDGRPDLIYTNGDGFDYAQQGTRAWHGLQWLENIGAGKFAYHRVGDLSGAYAPMAADLNGDGHLDLLAVSGFADRRNPNAPSLQAWINDGRERFTPLTLGRSPSPLITADVGDLDGDGVPEIVTGGFHAYPPYDRMSNISVWRQATPAQP